MYFYVLFCELYDLFHAFQIVSILHYYVPFIVITILSFSSFMTYHRMFNKCNTTNATSGTGTAYPSRTSEFTSFLVGFVLPVFSVQYCIVHWLSFWPVYCLSFEVRLLIISLVSLSFSMLFNTVIIKIVLKSQPFTFHQITCTMPIEFQNCSDGVISFFHFISFLSV